MMRSTLAFAWSLSLTAAALAAAPADARGQQSRPQPPPGAPAPASQQPAAPETTPTSSEYVPPDRNLVDLGLRGTWVDGDAARYERYRDLGSGAFLERFWLRRETARHWFLDAIGDHVGRRDQRYVGQAVLPGKFKILGQWDQIPMLMSESTETLFNRDTPNDLTIEDQLQAQVQASASALASVVQNARGFDLRSRRYIADGRMEYLPTQELTVRASFKHVDRDGVIPYGGSFGHGNVAETPAPVRHRLTDTNAAAEFMRGPALLRAGYTASLFHNEFTELIFDNPWRVQDTTTASSRGRSSLPPSNSMFNVNGLASVKLPRRTRASAYVAVGALSSADDSPVLPQTINAQNLGRLAPLPRTTVDGKGRTAAMNLAFTSRPTDRVDVTARYRLYDFDNQTPGFTILQRVPYDNAVGNLAAPLTTEPFGITRSSLDADVRVEARDRMGVGVGFSNYTDDRTFRIFESTSENVLRLSFDAVGTPRGTLRAKYEYSRKRGTLDEHGLAEMVALGEQPGMRHFDIAARNRNRFTILGSFMATDAIAVNASVAAGKDDYFESLFGLRDNSHQVYTAGIDAAPGERFMLGLSYSFEGYDSLSRSRQASPGQQNDESRNWATDGTDRVHSIIASVDVPRVTERIDLKFSLDFNNARSTYKYITGPVPDRTLPEESTVIASVLPPPSQLPPVRNRLTRTTTDVIYRLREHLAVGVSYWFERYRVNDFTLDPQAIPRLDLPGALLIGYNYRPYTANTLWWRIISTW